MTRRPYKIPIAWIVGVFVVVWFIGRYRGTYIGDPVFDRYLESHNGNIVEALRDAENPGLNPDGDIVSLGLKRSIRRRRMPDLYYNNVVLEYVKQVPSITSLGISPVCRIDDRGMTHVAEMTQLDSLSLNGLPITDAGLQKLHSLQNLKLFSAYVTDCSEEGIDEFRKAVPGCEVRWGSRK